jgi:hypothetical protein
MSDAGWLQRLFDEQEKQIQELMRELSARSTEVEILREMMK